MKSVSVPRIYLESFLLVIAFVPVLILAGNTDFMLMAGQSAIFALLALSVLLDRDFFENINRNFSNPCFRFYLALLVLAFFQVIEWTHLSIYPGHSSFSFRSLLSCFVAFLLAGRFIHERKSIIRFFSILMVLGAIEAGIGLSQAFSGRNTLLGLVTLPREWRASGTFYNSDHFAAFLELCLFCSIGLLVSVLPSRERYLRWRDRLYSLTGREKNIVLLLFLFSGLILLGIIFSKSRMGIFSTLAGLVFFIIVSLQRRSRGVAVRRLTYLVAGMVLLSAWLGLESVVERYKEAGIELDPEFGSRGLLWMSSLKAISDNPLTGSGIGTYQFAFMKHQPAHLQGFYTHAHNDYIEAAIEFGLLGLSIILAGAVLYFRSQLRIWKERHNHWARGLGLGALSALLSVAVHSSGDFVLRSYANGVLFSMMLAVAYNAVLMEKRDD